MSEAKKSDAFHRNEFVVMAIGNIIGSGIFLASAVVLQNAGRLAPWAYLFGGLIMAMEVAFLIELAIANPVAGSFKACAQEVFGPGWGFVNGWMFWVSGVLGMASEVIACSILMRLWFPAIPLWLFSMGFSVLITLVNLNDLQGLSKIEFALASIKFVTLAVFLFIGLLVIMGISIGTARIDPHIFSPVDSHWNGFLGSMLIVLYAYTGTGIIGMAATETKDAARMVPAAGLLVAGVVVVLYTAACWLLGALLPPESIHTELSPFVAAFSLFALPHASDIVNFILLTAVLSSLNSQVYSASRMLFSLAENGQAPHQLAQKNSAGTPVGAVYSSGGVLLFCALLSYVLPEKIFIYLISASGVLALVNWLSVCVTHYLYRKKYFSSNPERFGYRVPCYPYLSWLCFGSVFICLCSAFLVADQIPAIWASAVILGVLAMAYRLQKK